MTAAEIARALPDAYQVVISYATLRKWIERGRVKYGVHLAYECNDPEGEQLSSMAEVSTNHPAHRSRVLAECAAKRRIVDLHRDARGDCYSCSGDHGSDPTAAPCETVRELALPYADHPDYDEAWRP
jgi:hypothetical protein